MSEPGVRDLSPPPGFPGVRVLIAPQSAAICIEMTDTWPFLEAVDFIGCAELSRLSPPSPTAQLCALGIPTTDRTDDTKVHFLFDLKEAESPLAMTPRYRSLRVSCALS